MHIKNHLFVVSVLIIVCSIIVAPATITGQEKKKLSLEQWKYKIPIVLENLSGEPAVNGVTRIEIPLKNGMKKDLGDIRLIDGEGFEVPSAVSDVQEFIKLFLIFQVDVPAKGKAAYTLLYGNPNVAGKTRLSLINTPLNLVKNPSFEEADPKNSAIPASWSCRNLDLSNGSGRSDQDVFSGKYCLKINGKGLAKKKTSTLASQIFKLNPPLTADKRLLLFGANKSKFPNSDRGGTHWFQVPRWGGAIFYQYSSDWMVESVLLTVPNRQKDKTLKNIQLLVGAQKLSENTELWFDDVFIGRYFSLKNNVENKD